MRTKLLVLVVATALVVGATYVARAATADGAHGRGRASLTVDGVDAGAGSTNEAELDRLIGDFENDVHAHPTSTGLSFLGGLYLQRARVTGDLDTYLQAGTAIDAARRMAPTDAETLGREASFLYRTHDFSGAERLSAQIVASDPEAYGAMAVRGDALVELGDYRTAGRIYEHLAAVAPQTAAVDVRRSHLAFLEGRETDAKQLARAAEREALDSGEFGVGLAYYREAPGQLAFDSGHYDDAARAEESALRAAPGYYASLALLAKARAAQGRIDDAISLYERAVAIVPQPDYLGALGDLYAIKGDSRRAEQEYRTVELIGTLAQINRQVYNRLVATFDADHDRNVAEAVRLAGSELRVRKDVFGYDTYAWALLKAGRVAEARDASDHALALGTHDPRMLYHAGMIAKAQGDAVRARALLRRALALSPHFDPLQAPRARAALAALGG